jgi:hypothetical protein
MRQADYSWAQTNFVYANEFGTNQTASAPPVGSTLVKNIGHKAGVRYFPRMRKAAMPETCGEWQLKTAAKIGS